MSVYIFGKVVTAEAAKGETVVEGLRRAPPRRTFHDLDALEKITVRFCLTLLNLLALTNNNFNVVLQQCTSSGSHFPDAIMAHWAANIARTAFARRGATPPHHRDQGEREIELGA